MALLNGNIFKQSICILEDSKMQGLIERIKNASDANPYKNVNQRQAWEEQCFINFPLLYLSSVYLYNYAQQHGCDTFLFATRDCCHWHKIFKKLYPHTNVHYFDCSRNMFDNGIHNNTYKKYVRSLVDGKLDRTIFADIHGTGKRMFRYFQTEFQQVPYCFLISATYSSYHQFPAITRKYRAHGRFISLAFDSRGTPIEMLNYDLVGTLHNYFPNIGAVRDKLEYDYELIEPYHRCMTYLIENLDPIKHLIFSPQELKIAHDVIVKINEYIQVDRPIIAKYIKHVGTHIKNFGLATNILNDVSFEEIISNKTVYGLIWSGIYDERPCIIKVIKLDSGKIESPTFDKDDKAPFYHTQLKNLKTMNREAFKREVHNLGYLSKYRLVPKVYGSVIEDQKYDVHYGIIVMEQLDASLKDVLLKRNLHKDEHQMVVELINKLHRRAVHGDLKPSNIVVKYDQYNNIKQCYLIDCQKIKRRNDYSNDRFERLIKIDWNRYRMHFKKNKEMRE